MQLSSNNPISKTAFWTVGVRIQDAQSPNALCNDHLAHLFDCEAVSDALQHFGKLTHSALHIAARHRIIDDFIKDFIACHQEAQIILLGAGFDTRPFRLQGGAWFEIDEPEIIRIKEERLPNSGCGNPLTRISCMFTTTPTASTLTGVDPTRATLVVIEGVLMYLEPTQVSQLLREIGLCLPKAYIYCDVIADSFCTQTLQLVQSSASALHSPILFTPVDPERYFAEQGYTILLARRSISVLAEWQHSLAVSACMNAVEPASGYDVLCLCQDLSLIVEH